MAGRGIAVAPDLRLDLYGKRSGVHRLRIVQRTLQAGLVHAARCPWNMANGASLLFLRLKTAGQRGVQPAAEACLHIGNYSWPAFSSDRDCHLETRSVLVASVADGRLSLRATVALRHHVGAVGVHLRPFGYGGAARVEQLCFDADGMEEGP